MTFDPGLAGAIRLRQHAQPLTEPLGLGLGLGLDSGKIRVKTEKLGLESVKN